VRLLFFPAFIARVFVASDSGKLTIYSTGLQDIPYSRVAGFDWRILASFRPPCQLQWIQKQKPKLGQILFVLSCSITRRGLFFGDPWRDKKVWPGAAQKGRGLSTFLAYDEWDHSLPIDWRIGKASMINKKKVALASGLAGE